MARPCLCLLRIVLISVCIILVDEATGEFVRRDISSNTAHRDLTDESYSDDKSLSLKQEATKYNKLVARSSRSIRVNDTDDNEGTSKLNMENNISDETEVVTELVDLDLETTTTDLGSIVTITETLPNLHVKSPLIESGNRNKKSQSIDAAGQNYLPKDYSKLKFPKIECTNDSRENWGEWCGKVPVWINLDIIRVQDIDEKLGVLTLDMDMTLSWFDGGVRSKKCEFKSSICKRYLTLDPTFLEKVWLPNIYIDEMTRVRKSGLLEDPINVEFQPDIGWIEFISSYYPADTQNFTFAIRSYSHFSRRLSLSWEEDGAYFHDRSNPNFNLKLVVMNKTKLTSISRLDLTYDDHEDRHYDVLRFSILARRKLNFHMVQTYLPSVFFVVITWLCFLVPSNMVEARIGITMTTLLTLTSMFNSVREQSPQVCYVKAIDIWVVVCTFFIFMTLLEFITLLWLRYRRKALEDRTLNLLRIVNNGTSQNCSEEQAASDKTGFTQNLKRRLSMESLELKRYESVSEFVETHAFRIFAASFLLFNIIYWTWLLVASGYFEWVVDYKYNAEAD